MLHRLYAVVYLGLLAAGLGFEHFFDLRLDEAEAKAGIEGGTSALDRGGQLAVCHRLSA